MMAQGMTEEELLGRVVRRDEEALSDLYDRLAPRLLGMLVEILPDRGSAEQVLEDVFVRFWNEARRIGQVRASLAAWLFLLARAAAIDRLRAARRLPALSRSRPDPLQKFLAWLPRPEEIARLDERRRLLAKIMLQLPEPQRRALQLAVFEGFTQAEISEELGEPLGRVKSGLRAAMRFLRHRLRAIMGIWTANI